MSGTLMIGVSGVRGIVGTDLTPEVVARWAAAFGVWAKAGTGDGGKGNGAAVVLGRDARASGDMLAHAAAAGLLSVGCDVVFIDLVTTPGAQLAVEHHRAAGGIVVTASHNPIEWNALKFIGPDGIFLDGRAGGRVRALAEGGLKRGPADPIGAVSYDREVTRRHVVAVLKLLRRDVPAIRRRRLRVALDTVRGAGGAIMPALLKRLGCTVTAINTETDGQFPRAPEPLPENLTQLGALVRKAKAHVGLAVDPDVDRLAIVDETGTPIGEDYTLAFAVRALAKPGQTVVCNLSTSLVVDDAARDCGATVERVPVGEVHVARRLIEIGAAVGGEGNGGVIVPALHAGRDAPLAAALVLGLLARERAKVSEIVARSPRYTIVKAKVPRGANLDAVYAALRRQFGDAAVDTQDGLRLAWPDRWLHVRPSNTEPIVRLIAEARSAKDAGLLVDEGRRLCAAS